jgi:hypothetical protein
MYVNEYCNMSYHTWNWYQRRSEKSDKEVRKSVPDYFVINLEFSIMLRNMFGHLWFSQRWWWRFKSYMTHIDCCIVSDLPERSNVSIFRVEAVQGSQSSWTAWKPYIKALKSNGTWLTLYQWTWCQMLYSFFWVIPRRLNFMCQRFGTLCSIFMDRTTYENGTECPEMPAHRTQKTTFRISDDSMFCKKGKGKAVP